MITNKLESSSPFGKIKLASYISSNGEASARKFCLSINGVKRYCFIASLLPLLM
jgi:hypothetical protein